MCTQVNVILLTANLSCYSVVDKLNNECTQSKKIIETDTINSVSLYQIQAKFTKSSNSMSKISVDKSMYEKSEL